MEMFKYLNYLYKRLKFYLNQFLYILNSFKHQSLLKLDEIIGLFFILFFKNKNSFNDKVLLCRYQYYDKSQIQESHEKYQLFDTLKQRNVEVEEYFWDRKGILGFNNIAFILNIISLNPKFLILSSYSCNHKRPLSNPSILTLNRLKKITNVKVIQVLWDTCGSSIVESNKINNGLFDLNIITENPKLYFIEGKVKYANRILSLFTPYLENDFCFLGQVSSYRDYRNDYLNFLTNYCSNLRFYLAKSDRINQISHFEYAKVLSISKISINFSYSVDSHQLKGRVFESMLSGCLLLESKNEQIDEYFIDGVDFVSFTTKEDLLEKINFYSINESERSRISTNGRMKVLKHFSGDKFWETIFNNI